MRAFEGGGAFVFSHVVRPTPGLESDTRRTIIKYVLSGLLTWKVKKITCVFVTHLTYSVPRMGTG